MVKATIDNSNSSHDHINGNIATIINTTAITTNTLIMEVVIETVTIIIKMIIALEIVALSRMTTVVRIWFNTNDKYLSIIFQWLNDNSKCVINIKITVDSVMKTKLELLMSSRRIYATM